MCVTGFFGYEIQNYYSNFATAGPKSRVLFHLVTGEGAGIWSGSDRAEQVKSLLRLSPDIKQKTGFNPNGRDFANELRLFKRRETGEEHAPKVTQDASSKFGGASSRFPKVTLKQPRAPGPYMIFCKAERPKIVEANPSMAFGEVSAVLSPGHPHATHTALPLAPPSPPALRDLNTHLR